MKRKLIFGLIASLLIASPLKAFAASAELVARSNVIISEVNWGGSSLSNADEWLELQNLEGEAIDLTGWSIEGAATSGGVLTLPPGTIIEADSLLIISNYAADHSTLATEPAVVTTALALSNSALRLVLLDAAGITVDAVGDGGSPGGGSSGAVGFASMVRAGDSWSNAIGSVNFDQGVTQLGTPGVADVATPEPEPIIEEETVEIIEEPEVTAPEPESTPEEVIIDVEEEAVVELPDVIVEDIPVVETETITLSFAFGDLLINEIVSDPADGDEWVEIYNPYNNVISLEGWSVREAGGTSATLATRIGWEQYDVAEFSNRLNNSGDTVELIDPSGGVVDRVTFGELERGTSYARDDESFVVTTTPTRGEGNVITKEEEEVTVVDDADDEEPTEAVTESADCSETDDLQLLKLFPDPIENEENEFITIENAAEVTACLDGWVVRDLTKSYTLGGTLGAGLRLELPREVTRIALNNTSLETVELVSPSGEVVAQLSYETAIEGAFFTQVDGSGVWQNVPQELEQEVVQCPEPADADLESAEVAGAGKSIVKTKAKTTKTSTKSARRTERGVVIAAPGTFGEQVMYIDGLQLYQYTGDFPALQVGDVVEVIGTPSTTHGEPRLKLAGANDLAVVGAEAVEPSATDLANLDDYVGRLVQVEGMVSRRSGDRLTLENGGEELTVIAKENTDVSLSSLDLGTTLTVVGVVTSYDGSLRLLPRTQDDVSVQEAVEISTATGSKHTSTHPAGVALAGLTTSAVGARAWWWRRKKKSS